jgi:hypothetical protein
VSGARRRTGASAPSRALYRGAILAVAIVALAPLGLQLKWVLVQLRMARLVSTR